MQYKVIISICNCFAWPSIGESYKIPLDSQLQGFLLIFITMTNLQNMYVFTVNFSILYYACSCVHRPSSPFMACLILLLIPQFIGEWSSSQ